MRTHIVQKCTIVQAFMCTKNVFFHSVPIDADYFKCVLNNNVDPETTVFNYTSQST